MTKIFKFGGASVKDAQGVRNVAQIIQEQGSENNLVVVVSALGKTTNALEHIFDLAFAGQNFSVPFDHLKNQHLEIANSLFAGAEDEISSAIES